MILKVPFLENEYFWGGSAGHAIEMPIHKGSSYKKDLHSAPVQTMPMFLSTCGRYIWSDKPFSVWIEDGNLCFDGENIELTNAGSSLRDAYLAAMKAHFPFEGKKLPAVFFKTVQYNTWMECTYHPTQEKVMNYAHDLLKNGFEPGILIIDEGWASFYGDWEFDRVAFPDPKAMVDELHALGFIVMLWVVPMVRADGEKFIKQVRRDFNPENWNNMFLRNSEGEVALTKWWNGFSATLDMRKTCDQNFMQIQLDHLMNAYGIDGFKFDGGGFPFYDPKNIINGKAADDHDAAALNKAWNAFGARFTFHEYKDTFMGGGRSTIQRLLDRRHAWTGEGIDSILPGVLLAGLSGYPFICPDMIGGGEWTCAEGPNARVDEELFIRMAQVSALLPMMQFSWAPWRVLSKDGIDCMLDAARLHRDKADYILEQVENARITGEPIIRTLEYNYPHCGYENILDQFMVGEKLLVCPVIEEGKTEITVALPKGSWRESDGKVYCGGQTVTVPAPVNKLVWFEKI